MSEKISKETIRCHLTLSIPLIYVKFEFKKIENGVEEIFEKKTMVTKFLKLLTNIKPQFQDQRTTMNQIYKLTSMQWHFTQQ